MWGVLWNYHLFILMDCELFVLIGRGGLWVIMLLLGSIETEQHRLLHAGKGQCFIHCWPWLYLSTMAELSMYRKFHAYWSLSRHEGQRVKIQTVLWNDLWNLLWMSLLYADRAGSVLQHYPPFTRCWSNVASCQALTASGCSVSDSSLSVSSVSTLWWFALGEGSRPGSNHHTTGGHHSLWGRLFWIPGGPESLKRSVLWRACWEEGCYSWRERVRVGHL